MTYTSSSHMQGWRRSGLALALSAACALALAAMGAPAAHASGDLTGVYSGKAEHDVFSFAPDAKPYVRHAVVEASRVHPALDVVRGTIGGVDNEGAGPHGLGDLGLRPERAHDRPNADLPVEAPERGCGSHRLGPADVGRGEQHLAVQVAELDDVAVHERELADAAAGQVERDPGAKPAHSEHHHAGGAQVQLAVGGG